jgi:hypothetical protein
MAKLSRKDFCKKYGLAAGTLRQHLLRGKVVEVNGIIDESSSLNKQYIANYSDPNHKPQPSYIPPKKEKVEKVKSEPSVEENEIDLTPPEYVKSMKSVEALRAEKLQEEIDKLRLQNEKQRGELVPVELIKPVFIQFSKSVTTAFQNEAENILIEIGHKKKLTREEQSDLRVRFRSIINQAVDGGVKDTKKNLGHITSEFSQVRLRGERK